MLRVLRPRAKRETPLTRTHAIVRHKMAQRDAGVSEAEWATLREATLLLSVPEARQWYRAFARMAAEGRAPRRHPFCRVLHFEVERFVAAFLSNGRWMEHLADAIEQPDVALRKAHAARVLRAASAGAVLQRQHSERAARESRTRLALRDAAARAYLAHGAALRRRFPQVRWEDAASTPDVAWSTVRLSELSPDERLAAWHAVQAAPTHVRERVAPYVVAAVTRP